MASGIHDPELDAQIVRAFEANPEMTKTALAGFLGTSRSTIDRALKRAGVDHMIKNSKFADEELWSKIKAALDADPAMVREDVVKQFKISYSTFDRMISYFGYDMRSRYEKRRTLQRKKNINWDAVLDALENTDATVFDITRKLGITHHELREFCDKQGIDLRERRKELMDDGVHKSTESFDAKETIDGKGLSFIAHRLPLNRIAEVFR